MKQVIRIAAGEHERFAPRAFDSLTGGTVPLAFRETGNGPVIAELGRGRVISAEVAEDGSEVTLTLEVPDAPVDAAAIEQAAGRFSFAVPVKPDWLRRAERNDGARGA